MGIAQVAVLIPAFRPTSGLVSLIEALRGVGFLAIVVVDDGSGDGYQHVFAQIKRFGPTLLRHAVNLGKGAALKTGMNHVLCEYPHCAGVVTADADGQHDPADVINVAAALGTNPRGLVMGSRSFNTGVPMRSRFGNLVTRTLFRAAVGQSLSDTQTGLRGIPASLMPYLLSVPSNGYDFELDMLLLSRHSGCPVREIPIRTIYLDKNSSSHFNPLFDSMRIFFVLLRFSIVSLLTAALDNVVFVAVFHFMGGILVAQIVARLAALILNYSATRKTVFFSHEAHRRVLPKYLLVVASSGIVSFGLINFFHNAFGINPIYAKVIAECTLFIANFAILRDFVFTKTEEQPAATDWDRYYQSVPPTARLTRKYTESVLIKVFTGASSPTDRPVILELGGANSCFLDGIAKAIKPQAYHIVDNNRFGLELMKSRTLPAVDLRLYEQDVTSLTLPIQADNVFSIGLIEHFIPEVTRAVVQAHFAALRPGGHAIISFPTPTLLYRVARFCCELLGLWKFPDERPLERQEVVSAVGDLGELVFEKLMIPLIFTQRLMVFHKLQKDMSSTPNSLSATGTADDIQSSIGPVDVSALRQK